MVDRFQRSNPNSPSTPVASGEVGQAGAQKLIDAVREVCARVVDRHIDLKLCRKLFGDGGRVAFAMASHLAEDIRCAIVEDHARVREALANLSTPTPDPVGKIVAHLIEREQDFDPVSEEAQGYSAGWLAAAAEIQRGDWRDTPSAARDELTAEAQEMGLPSREIYEGSGGWADGRLGQAYDLIDAVLRDQHPEHDSRSMLKKLLGDVESCDIEIGIPS